MVHVAIGYCAAMADDAGHVLCCVERAPLAISALALAWQPRSSMAVQDMRTSPGATVSSAATRSRLRGGCLTRAGVARVDRSTRRPNSGGLCRLVMR